MSEGKKLTFDLCKTSELVYIATLADEIWPSTFKNILSEEQIKYMLNWMYNPQHLLKQQESGHRFFLIRENNKEIGFAGVEGDFPTIGDLRIHKIYLIPEIQGKGVGKWALNQIENLAHESKMSRIHLNVNRYNSATQFYERCGFKIIKEEDIDIGDGYFMNDFVMVKDLH
jgi:diamine N-acetyltransferase